MIRPVVVHVSPIADGGARLAELLPHFTATLAVTGQVRRAHLVHCHGAEAMPVAIAETERLGVPLVVSLDPADVAGVSRFGATVDRLRRAGLVTVETSDDLATVVAAGVEVSRVAVLARGRAVSTPDGAVGTREPALDLLATEIGGCVADLEEHYLALLSTGRPAAPRRPLETWPDVAVVVVTHNRRATLVRCLAALETQSYPPDRVQVVVVDNASTDGSAEILEAWSGPRRTVIRCDDHVMPVIARNLAVQRVGVDVVAFTDDDCYPTPDWLAALVCGFRDGVALVQGRIEPDPAGELKPLSRTQWTPAEYGAYETANVAYRRDRLPAGPFDVDFAGEVARVLGRRFGRYPFGEDAELAWRVKRAGGDSRFSATALVHHHVWPPDTSYLLRRAVVAAAFPVLVRRVPELRDTMLWRRWFVTRRSAELLLASGGLLAATRCRPAAALAAPYLWSRLGPTAPGRKARLRAMPILMLRDVVEASALVYGSVRSRTPVL